MIPTKLIMSSMVALALGCPEPMIENHTGTWNEYDQSTLDRAKKRCAEIFPEAPCIKKFIKKDDLTFNVVCGERAKIYE